MEVSEARDNLHKTQQFYFCSGQENSLLKQIQFVQVVAEQQQKLLSFKHAKFKRY